MIGMTKGEWFLPKRYGYGAGRPIAWRGWALLLAYVGLLAGAGFGFLPDRLGAFYGVTAVASLTLVMIAARHTRGGWRWRWGDDA